MDVSIDKLAKSNMRIPEHDNKMETLKEKLNILISAQNIIRTNYV